MRHIHCAMNASALPTTTADSLASTATRTDSAFVTAREVARHYSVTPATIFRWATDGRIPSLKFQGTTRFDLAAVRAVIEAGSQKAHLN